MKSDVGSRRRDVFNPERNADQRDEDETKADQERDSCTFTLDAPGSVSEKTQIAAAASE